MPNIVVERGRDGGGKVGKIACIYGKAEMVLFLLLALERWLSLVSHYILSLILLNGLTSFAPHAQHSSPLHLSKKLIQDRQTPAQQCSEGRAVYAVKEVHLQKQVGGNLLVVMLGPCRNECLEDSKLCAFEPSAMISRNLSRQSEFNRHQKSQSAHYRPSGQRRPVKTELSSAVRPLSILSRLTKRKKQPKMTINELMKNKFHPCRSY